MNRKELSKVIILGDSAYIFFSFRVGKTSLLNSYSFHDPKLRRSKVHPILQSHSRGRFHVKRGHSRWKSHQPRGKFAIMEKDLGHCRPVKVPNHGQRFLPRRWLLRPGLRHHQQKRTLFFQSKVIQQHLVMDKVVLEPGCPPATRQVPIHPCGQQDRQDRWAIGWRGVSQRVPRQKPKDQAPYDQCQEQRWCERGFWCDCVGVGRE